MSTQLPEGWSAVEDPPTLPKGWTAIDEPSLADRAGDVVRVAGDAVAKAFDTVAPVGGVVDQGIRLGLRTVPAVVGAAAGVPAGPGGMALTGAAGAGVGDLMAQTYEQARGIRPAISPTENAAALATGAIAPVLPMPAAAPGAGSVTRQFVTNVGKSAGAGAAVGGAVDTVSQTIQGTNDYQRNMQSAGLGALLGTLGGAIAAGDLAAAQKQFYMGEAQKQGFRGKSWSDLKQWVQEQSAFFRRQQERNVTPGAAPVSEQIPAPAAASPEVVPAAPVAPAAPSMPAATAVEAPIVPVAPVVSAPPTTAPVETIPAAVDPETKPGSDILPAVTQGAAAGQQPTAEEIQQGIAQADKADALRANDGLPEGWTEVQPQVAAAAPMAAVSSEIPAAPSSSVATEASPTIASPAAPIVPEVKPATTVDNPRPTEPSVTEQPGVSQWLQVDVPTNAIAEENTRVAKRNMEQLNKQLSEINDGIKQAEKLVLRQTGPKWERGKIKQSAKASDVKTYRELQAKKTELLKQADALQNLNRADVKATRQIEIARKVNDAALPPVVRLANRVELFNQQNPEQIPADWESLKAAFDQEISKEIRKRFPDATDQEVRYLNAPVERAAFGAVSASEFDRSFQMDPELSLAGFRAKQVTDALTGANFNTWRQDAPEFANELKRYLSAARGYEDHGLPPVEALTAEKTQELIQRATSERKTIEAAKEAKRKFEQAQFEKTKLAQGITKIVTANGVTISPTPKLEGQVAKLSDRKQLQAQREFLEKTLRELAAVAPADTDIHPDFKVDYDTAIELQTNWRAGKDISTVMPKISDLADRTVPGWRSVESFFAPAKYKGGAAQLDHGKLIDEVVKALKGRVPEGTPAEIIIQVPNDGTFRFQNWKSTLLDAAESVRKSFGRGLGPTNIATPATRARAIPKLGAESEAAKVVGEWVHDNNPDFKRIMRDGAWGFATNGKAIIAVKGLNGTTVGDGKTKLSQMLRTEAPDLALTDSKGIERVVANGPKVDETTTDLIKKLNSAVAALQEDGKKPAIQLHTTQDEKLGVSYSAAGGDAYMSDGVVDGQASEGSVDAVMFRDLMESLRRLGVEQIEIMLPKPVQNKDLKGHTTAIAIKGGDNIFALIKPPTTTNAWEAAPSFAQAETPEKPTESKPKKGSKRAGGSAVGDPISGAVGMPPIPPGVPSARINSSRMPVALDRIAPGSRVITVEEVHAAMLDLIKTLGGDTAVVEGRFYQQARGIARPREEAIHVDQLTNLPTLAHEVAHVLSKYLFGSMQSRAMIAGIANGAVARELRVLGKALYGNITPAAGYTAEGFSELVRLWLTTEEAPTKAPTAAAWFEQTLLPSRPGLREAFIRARDAVDLWRGQGSEGRFNAQHRPDPGVFSRWIRNARELFSRKAVVEEFAPLEAMAEFAERMIGGKLLPASNPALVAQSVRQIAGAMLETWVERGITDINGNIVAPSLREAYAELRRADAQPFANYLLALQVIERARRGFETGFAIEDAVHIRDTFGADPRFVRAAQKVADWNAGGLKYWRDAFPEQNDSLYRSITARNPKYYAPMARVLDPEKVKPAQAGAASSNVARFKGSTLPVKHVIEQSLRGMETLIARAHRDMVMRAIVGLNRLEGMSRIMLELPRTRILERVNIEKIRKQLEDMGVDTDPIPDDEILSYGAQLEDPTGVDPIISLQLNGKTRWFQVPADVYEVVKGVQEPNRLGPIFEILFGGPARAFRLGTTGLRPAFSLITNPLRDFQTYQLQSIYGNPASRTAAYFAAMRDIVFHGLTDLKSFSGSGVESDLMALYHQLGLQSSTYVGGDIAHIKRESAGLFRHGKWFRRITTPIETAREALSFTELIPRLAELSVMLQEAGWKPGDPLSPNQVVQARLAFKRATTDFSAKGGNWGMVRRAIPFSGATIQGVRSMARAAVGDQGPRQRSLAMLRFLLNGLASITTLALWEWWSNKDKDWYKALPQRERQLYWNLEMGNQVIQIPKPMEWGALFAAVPIGALESWYQKDPKAVGEALAFFATTTNPLDWPTPIKAAKEQWMNRLDFFDRPIVPRGELDLQPGSQAGRYTSELGKALGRAFPETVSPRRFDAAVRAVLGGLGGDMLDGPEAIMRKLGLAVKERESEPADLPVVGRLFRRGGKDTANNRFLLEFYDDLNRYRAMRSSYDRAIKQRAEEIAQQGKPSTPMPKDISPKDLVYSRVLDARYIQVRAFIDVAERLPDLERRQRLYRMAGEMARQTVSFRPPER